MDPKLAMLIKFIAHISFKSFANIVSIKVYFLPFWYHLVILHWIFILDDVFCIVGFFELEFLSGATQQGLIHISNLERKSILRKSSDLSGTLN